MFVEIMSIILYTKYVMLRQWEVFMSKSSVGKNKSSTKGQGAKNSNEGLTIFYSGGYMYVDKKKALEVGLKNLSRALSSKSNKKTTTK